MLYDTMKIATQNPKIRRDIIHTRKEGIEFCLNIWATKIPGDFAFKVINTEFYDEALMYINRTLSEYREYVNG
jgi:hypothetical protein